MQISEIARRSGVSASAIRYYESEGLMPAPARSGGRRDYDLRAVERLRLIAAAQRFGFRLQEIREMLEVTNGKEPRGGWRAWVQAKVQEIEVSMQQMQCAQELLVRSLQCACEDLITCGKKCDWAGNAGTAKIPVGQISSRKKRKS